MEECSLVGTPVVTGCKLSKDDESPKVNKKLFKTMIGRLLYLATFCSYIMQVVGLVSRYQSTPKQSHLLVEKIIFKYLKGIMDNGLWYPKG